MILDVEKCLGDERFVGRKLDDLLWSSEVNAERSKYPDPKTLNLAVEIPSTMEWEV